MSGILRRAATRRAAQTYVDACYARGHHPTTGEIADAVLSVENTSFRAMFRAVEIWTRREVLSMMQEKDPATKLRRHLLLLADDGERRWHAHEQLTFEGLDNSGRFITRPQADSQARSERMREIEREVVRAMEQELGRPVHPDEAWPRVQERFAAEGL